MQIIQVIDLDGTTVKVDNTNPTEPKIASALRFDTDMRKNVAIGGISELVFAKPLNANMEAICVGYKGTDGKYYGITGNGEESIFAAEQETQTEKFVLDIREGGPANMTLEIVTSRLDVTGRDAYPNGPLYIRIGEATKLYKFILERQDHETGRYWLQSTEPYEGERPTGVLRVEVYGSDDTQYSAYADLLPISATQFAVSATNDTSISTVFTPVIRE